MIRVRCEDLRKYSVIVFFLVAYSFDVDGVASLHERVCVERGRSLLPTSQQHVTLSCSCCCLGVILKSVDSGVELLCV